MKLQAFSVSFLSRRFRTLVLVLVAMASSVALAEDCIPFNTSDAVVRTIGGRLKIVSGNSILLDFGGSRAEAEQALRVIQHYGLNSQCFVGRPDPSLEYYLVDGQTPRGPLAGEDSIPFDPARLQIVRVDGRIKIVDGNHQMLDFGTSVTEAREALVLIRKYGFNRICFVGRPDPSMIYFRADENCSGPAIRDVALESTQLTINGARVQYKVNFADDCGEALDAVVQTWIVQGETFRAAGGVRVACEPGGDCTKVFTIGAEDQRARGRGEFVPGRAVAVFQLKVGSQVVSERRLPVELSVDCAGPALTDVTLESEQLTINGERVGYEVSFADDCGEALDAVVQTWIVQGETFRAAGGVRVACEPGGDCTKAFTIGAEDQRARGRGEFVPGPAVAVFQLKVGSEVVSERRLRVALVGQEDCVSFDSRRLQIVSANGSILLVEGNHSLMDFPNRAEAVRALEIIRHYRMDSMCFVGRPDPSMQYFLVGGEAPRGPIAGEDAIAFDPERLEVRRVSGRIKIVEDNHLLLDFGDNVEEAGTALEIIREYGFNRICFVGRPDSSMMYFRIAEENEAVEEGPSFVRGDANGSGEVEVNDGVVLSQVLFLGDSDGASCPKALDVNDSGEVGFDDLIHLYQFLFTRGAPPAAPFPSCGADPTDDRLECERRCD